MLNGRQMRCSFCFIRFEYHQKRILNNIRMLFPSIALGRTAFLSQFSTIYSVLLPTITSHKRTTTKSTKVVLTRTTTTQRNDVLQMRLLSLLVFHACLSTALSYKGCIINLIVYVSCSVSSTHVFLSVCFNGFSPHMKVYISSSL